MRGGWGWREGPFWGGVGETTKTNNPHEMEGDGRSAWHSSARSEEEQEAGSSSLLFVAFAWAEANAMHTRQRVCVVSLCV